MAMLRRHGRRLARLLSTPARDRLVLEGLVFHGRHGVIPAERELGQKFRVDVSARTCLARAGASDRVEDTVSYVDVYEVCRAALEGPPRSLLERVAAEIAEETLRRFRAVEEVTVAVRKPHVAVPGPVDALGVEITRRR